MMRRPGLRLLLVALLLVGCAAPAWQKAPVTETPYDQQLDELNAQLCKERGGTPPSWKSHDAARRPPPGRPRVPAVPVPSRAARERPLAEPERDGALRQRRLRGRGGVDDRPHLGARRGRGAVPRRRRARGWRRPRLG